jgi:hypothetical protein
MSRGDARDRELVDLGMLSDIHQMCRPPASGVEEMVADPAVVGTNDS